MDLVEDLDLYEEIGMYPETMRRILAISIEIVREGLEGKKIGTMFVIGDSDKVLERSQPLILDPINRHQVEVRSIHNKDIRETIKKLAYLDGAFIISEEGVVVSAARYINPKTSGKVSLGVGTRHVTGAAITSETRSVAIIISSSGNIRVYAKGKLFRDYKIEIKLRTCPTGGFNGFQDSLGLEGMPAFNSDNFTYIHPQPYIYGENNGTEKGGKPGISNDVNVVTILFGENNRSVDYSFLSPTNLSVPRKGP